MCNSGTALLILQRTQQESVVDCVKMHCRKKEKKDKVSKKPFQDVGKKLTIGGGEHRGEKEEREECVCQKKRESQKE